MMWSFDDGEGIVWVTPRDEVVPAAETLEQEVARLRRVLKPPTRDPLMSRILRAIFAR